MTIAGRHKPKTKNKRRINKMNFLNVEVNTMFIKFSNFKKVPKSVRVAYFINVILILAGCFLLVADIFEIAFPFNAYIPAMICIIIANLINITVINKYRSVLKG